MAMDNEKSWYIQEMLVASCDIDFYMASGTSETLCTRQEFFKPKASITLDGWPLEFDWLEDQTFDKGFLEASSWMFVLPTTADTFRFLQFKVEFKASKHVPVRPSKRW